MTAALKYRSIAGDVYDAKALGAAGETTCIPIAVFLPGQTEPTIELRAIPYTRADTGQRGTCFITEDDNGKTCTP